MKSLFNRRQLIYPNDGMKDSSRDTSKEACQHTSSITMLSTPLYNSFIYNMPMDILGTYIIIYLDTKSISECMFVCKEWQYVLDLEYVWKNIYLNHIHSYKYLTSSYKESHIKSFITGKNWSYGLPINKRWHGSDVNNILSSAASAAGRHYWDAHYVQIQNHRIIIAKDVSLIVYDIISSKCLYFADMGRFCYSVYAYNDYIFQHVSYLSFIVWKIPSVLGRLQFVGNIQLSPEVGFVFSSILSLCVNEKYFIGVTSDGSNIIKVWDRVTGVLIKRLIGHSSSILNLYVNDMTVVSVSRDYTVGVWSLTSGARLFTLRKHKSKPRNVRLINDFIITWNSRELIVWSLANGDIIFCLFLNITSIINERVSAIISGRELIEVHTCFLQVIQSCTIVNDNLIIATSTLPTEFYGSKNKIVTINLSSGKVQHSFNTEGQTIVVSNLYYLPPNKILLTSIDHYAGHSTMINILDFEYYYNEG